MEKAGAAAGLAPAGRVLPADTLRDFSIDTAFVCKRFFAVSELVGGFVVALETEEEEATLVVGRGRGLLPALAPREGVDFITAAGLTAPETLETAAFDRTDFTGLDTNVEAELVPVITRAAFGRLLDVCVNSPIERFLALN